MFSDNRLLAFRRALAAALSVAAIGMVSPAWAHPTDDDDSGDKKEVRVYRMGGDDDSNGGDAHVYKYKVQRADSKGGYLGVRVQDISRTMMKARELPTDEGALVNRVEEGSPADEAGIVTGDVIVEVNRVAVKDSDELIEAMKNIQPGTKTDVILIRNGLRKTLKVEVAKRPKNMMMVSPGWAWKGSSGMSPDDMRELKAQLRQIDPEKMRMMTPGPEFQDQMQNLREELDQLRNEIRELREELQEARERQSGD